MGRFMNIINYVLGKEIPTDAVSLGQLEIGIFVFVIVTLILITALIIVKRLSVVENSSKSETNKKKFSKRGNQSREELVISKENRRWERRKLDRSSPSRRSRDNEESDEICQDDPFVDKFIKFSLSRPILTNIIAVVIIAGGIYALYNMQRQRYPDVPLEELYVTTIYPAASAREVELDVTKNIEDKVVEVDHVGEVRSFSMENFSFIKVSVDKEADNPDDVKDNVRRAIDGVTLPAVITEKPKVHEVETSWLPVIIFAISDEKATENELRSIAKRLEFDIERIDGVARVDKLGYRDREISVQVDPTKMQEKYVSLKEVAQALATRNVRLTAGSLKRTKYAEKIISTKSKFNSGKDVEKLIVRSNFDGKSVTLGDIGIAEETFKENNFEFRANGTKSIGLRIHKNKTADAMRLVERIRAYLEREKPNLSSTLKVIEAKDLTQLTRRRIEILKNNIVIGFAIIFFILLIFLNLKIAFWTSIGIPIAVSAGLFVHYNFAGSIDSVSIIGFILVLGMIVDDAIVISENIFRHRAMGNSRVRAACDGFKEVILAIFATVGTTIIAFIPLFNLGGKLGKFVVVVPLVVICTLIGSIIEAVFVLPSHVAAKDSKKSKKPRKPLGHHVMNFITKSYGKLLLGTLKVRYAVVFIAVGLTFAACYYAFGNMRISLFPQEGAEEIMVHIEVDPASSFEKTSQVVKMIEERLLKVPKEELRSFSTYIGNDKDQTGDMKWAKNVAFIHLFLAPFSTREVEGKDIAAKIREYTNTIKEIQSISYQVIAGGPPVGRSVELNFVGGTNEDKRTVLQKMRKYLGDLDGVYDPVHDLRYNTHEEVLNINYKKMSQYGLNVADVASTIRTALEGHVVTKIYLGDDEVGIRLKYNEGTHKARSTISKLEILNQYRKLIPLGNFANLTKSKSLQVISRYQGLRSSTLTADVDDRIATSLGVRNRILNQFEEIRKDHPLVKLVISGEAVETEKTFWELIQLGTYIVVTIFFVLSIYLNSMAQSLFVISTIPFSIVGVIIAFTIHDMSLGFLALIGMLGMLGVVVNDSIIMLTFVNQNLKKYSKTNKCKKDIIMDAAQTRLRPILLAGTTTIAGVFPTAYGIGGADPFIIPMVMSMGWGLIFSMMISLLIVPSLRLILIDMHNLLSYMGKDNSSTKPKNVVKLRSKSKDDNDSEFKKAS
jgi:multidrug efflux pump subunit AcrB